MSARNNILGRLRRAPVGSPVPLPDLGPWRKSRPAVADAAARIALFRANMEAAHAEVHDVTKKDWPVVLLRLAAAKRVKTLLFAADTAQGAQLATQRVEGLQLISYDRHIAEWRDQLFDCVDGAFTRAMSAIADTGGLVLWPDVKEPRLMSLVPPIHFVLLDDSRIHLDLHAAMSDEQWALRMPTNAVVISGPSKTADIQQTLAYGAHGPRELVVLLCHANGDTS